MAKMVRKQVYIRPEDQRLLSQTAKALDVPESEVIRRGIAEVAQEPEWHFDPQAWRDLRMFIAERQALTTLPNTREWARDDLYRRGKDADD